jgi:hypothetical protein
VEWWRRDGKSSTEARAAHFHELELNHNIEKLIALA